MRFDKFTIKSQELIHQAHSLAGDKGHQAIEPIHFLGALLKDTQGMAVSILNKIGVSPNEVAGEVDAALEIQAVFDPVGVEVSDGDGECRDDDSDTAAQRFDILLQAFQFKAFDIGSLHLLLQSFIFFFQFFQFILRILFTKMGLEFNFISQLLNLGFLFLDHLFDFFHL